MKLSDIREPKFEVEVTDKDRRAYCPYTLNDRLLEYTGKNRYDRVRYAFDLPSLSRAQCMELQSALTKFLYEITPTRKKMRHVAELMRFYHIQPSEIEMLSVEERMGLIGNMNSINARERLQFQDDISIAMAGKDGKEFKMNLIELAYADDPERHADLLEAITRK